MKRQFQKIALILTLGFSAAGVAYAPKASAYDWATEPTLWVLIAQQTDAAYTQQAQSAQQYLTLANQLITDYQQLSMATDNFTKFTPQQWTQAAQDILQIVTILQGSNSLYAANISSDQTLRNLFPTYSDTILGHNLPANVFAQQFQNISAATTNQLNNILQTSGMQLTSMATTEAAKLFQHQLENQSAQGQTALMQTTNALLIDISSQIQKVRELLILQNNALTVSIRKQQIADDRAVAAQDDWMYGAPTNNWTIPHP